MNIWLVTIGEVLPVAKNEKRQRTALLADELVKKGHDVTWWTSAFNHFKKEWLFEKDTDIVTNTGLKIIVLKGRGYKRNISLSRFIDHRIIAKKFRRLAPKKSKPDIIIASMPSHDLAYEAVIFSKANNLPILVDVRDPWPDLFLEHIPHIFRRIARFILYKDFLMVKKIMQMTDGLVSPTNPFLEWGLKYAERKETEKDRIFSLGYKKHKISNDYLFSNRFADVANDLKDKFIVIFVGTISKSYHNPFILLKAAEKLKRTKGIHFVIAGDGELFKELKTEAKCFNNITLTGWLNQDEIEYWLKQSKIGICPATKIVNLPTNKVYAYLSAGLPVISAFHGYMKELIEKYQIGFYYPPNDSDALVEYIQKLYNNPVLHKEISENAKKIFDEMYDADKIYEEYAEHIEQIVLENKNKRNSTGISKYPEAVI